MTVQLNQTQLVSAAQEKNKMPCDHEPLSASTQRSSMPQSISHDRSHSSFQPASDCQPALCPCIYIALLCPRCGSIRQAIADLPTQSLVACPECNRECSFLLLGSGFTTRSLPFHQVHRVEPMRWDQSIESEINSS